MKKMILGSFQTNCYIVENDKKEVFIVDPGDNGKKIAKYLNDNELHLTTILLTHGHFDHVGAVDYLYDKYKCKIYAHKETIDLVKDSYLNLSVMENEFVVKAPILEAPNYFNINGYLIEWMFLPGHCQGSSMIYLKDKNIIFSGDVLFRGSIGRYDFPSSSKYDTIKSLNQIKQLDFDAIIYPGHGEETTLRFEIENNMYLK
jgi:glyoxylase-like metal-dependent hydrolase (beta-lactamase superfamily II)